MSENIDKDEVNKGGDIVSGDRIGTGDINIGSNIVGGDTVNVTHHYYGNVYNASPRLPSFPLSFSPDGRLLAAIRSGNIYVWDTQLGDQVTLFDRDYLNSSAIAWSSQNSDLVTVKRSKPIFFSLQKDKSSRTYPFKPTQDVPSKIDTGSKFISRDNSIVGDITGSGGVAIGSGASVTINNVYNSSNDTKPNIANQTISWSPDLTKVAIVDFHDIEVYEADSSKLIFSASGHTESINCVMWSPIGDLLASSADDSTIKIWDSKTGELKQTLKGHSLWVTSLSWSPNRKHIASCGGDTTIRIWDVESGWQLNTLEGHTNTITRIVFSPDGQLLISISLDNTLRVWRTDTWETITVHAFSSEIPLAIGFESGLVKVAFYQAELDIGHSSRAPEVSPYFEKVVDLKDGNFDLGQIKIVILNLIDIQNALPKGFKVSYSNAKVVLVGDSGVGKSGLALVLTDQPFESTDSTHGRHVRILERKSVQIDANNIQNREIVLWDLAGQPGYRRIHQLYLSDVSVALLVFDTRNETDPFAGVLYWNRALQQAQRILGKNTILKKFLVAARVDRGGIGASKRRISSLVDSMGFDGYFETSAKEGWDILSLRQAIKDAIEWHTLPNVVTNDLFQLIRAFLLEEKKAGHLISSQDNLYLTFLQARSQYSDTPELKAQFLTVIGRIESNGLLRRLSFASLILLQPELLDSYASIIINAARDEPDGLGSILESDVIDCNLRMPESERLPNSEQEKLLLISAVEDMLRHEIALREHSESGSYLVFPSQFTRERADLPDPPGQTTVFQFEGATLNIYTTLAVRLSHSGVFSKREMWKNAAVYNVNGMGSYGIYLHQIDEGAGRITLFADGTVVPELQSIFEQFVHNHLNRRVIKGSLSRKRIISCPDCGFQLTDQLIELRRQRGFDWISCPVCSFSEISFEPSPSTSENADGQQSMIEKMDEVATLQKTVDVNTSVLEGKKSTGEFDVFLSHADPDRQWIQEWLLPRLESNGIHVFQEKHFQLGVPILENIEYAIGMCPRTILILTPAWVKSKWRTFDSLLLQTDDPANIQRRMIPVLVEDCEIPKRIALLARADLTDIESQEDELQRIVVSFNNG